MFGRGLEYLWRTWSPQFDDLLLLNNNNNEKEESEEEKSRFGGYLNEIKATYSEPRVLNHVLLYYRQLLRCLVSQNEKKRKEKKRKERKRKEKRIEEEKKGKERKRKEKKRKEKKGLGMQKWFRFSFYLFSFFSFFCFCLFPFFCFLLFPFRVRRRSCSVKVEAESCALQC